VAGSWANHYFTFSNAQKSEKVGAISQPTAGQSVALPQTTQYFTFSLFHAPASSNFHILEPILSLRAWHTPRS
jgi:hypothetical protein